MTREAVTDQPWLPFISYSRMVKNWRHQNNKIHKNTSYYRAGLNKDEIMVSKALPGQRAAAFVYYTPFFYLPVFGTLMLNQFKV